MSEISGPLFQREICGIEARVWDTVDSGIDDMRHVDRGILHVFGTVSLMKLVDGAAEKVEPPLESRPIHRSVRQEACMDTQGISPESAVAEQDRLPEGIQLWEMSLPVDPGNPVEYRSENVVCANLRVEVVDDPFDVRTASDIVQGMGIGH